MSPIPFVQLASHSSKKGMAIRLAFVLALHQDLSTYVQKGLVSEAEVELRRTVFWAACVGDW